MLLGDFNSMRLIRWIFYARHRDVSLGGVSIGVRTPVIATSKGELLRKFLPVYLDTAFWRGQKKLLDVCTIAICIEQYRMTVVSVNRLTKGFMRQGSIALTAIWIQAHPSKDASRFIDTVPLQKNLPSSWGEFTKDELCVEISRWPSVNDLRPQLS